MNDSRARRYNHRGDLRARRKTSCAGVQCTGRVARLPHHTATHVGPMTYSATRAGWRHFAQRCGLPEHVDARARRQNTDAARKHADWKRAAGEQRHKIDRRAGLKKLIETIAPMSPIRHIGRVESPSYNDTIQCARVRDMMPLIEDDTYDPLFDGWGDLTPYRLQHRFAKKETYKSLLTQPGKVE